MADDDLGGRVLVLERETARHDKDIRDIREIDLKEIREQLTELNICAASLPKIDKTLEGMAEDIKNLRECKIAAESHAKGERTFWDKYGNILTKILFFICGAGALFLWDLIMHLYGGR